MDNQRRVYLCSTYYDLKNECGGVIKELKKMEFAVVSGPEPLNGNAPTWEQVKRVIDSCDYFVLILGNNTGDHTENWISMIEAEYEYAVHSQKPVVSFIHKKFELPLSNEPVLSGFKAWKDNWVRLLKGRWPFRYWATVEQLTNEIREYFERLTKKLSVLFEDATTNDELIAALTKTASDKKNKTNGITNYVWHYTKLSTIVAILKRKRWYIGSPLNMNDGLEKIHVEDAQVKNLFFASFCLDNTENMGMWSMYAQPWDEGVIIRIPLEKLKKWVNSKTIVYDADKGTKESRAPIENAKITFHAVAYSNADSKEADEPELLVCGESQNTHFAEVQNNVNLVGYTKDIAWAYENEYRIRIETDPSEKHDAVAIDISDEVLSSFEFITGPRFEGNFLRLIRKEVGPRLDPVFKGSLFTERLTWVYCDSCPFKKKTGKESTEAN